MNWRSTSRPSQSPLALSVPLSRFTSQFGGGSAFVVDMMRAISSVTFLLAAISALAGEPRVDEALFTAARKSLPRTLSSNAVFRALGSGVWDTNRTAVAVAVPQPKATVIFVFLRQTNSAWLAVDVSAVEGGNFGKLGLGGREPYERFETVPIEWRYFDDGYFSVVMRTRAWKGGKRYTVSETLVITPMGTVIWR